MAVVVADTAEGPTDYLSRLLVPELVDGLMTQLVDDRPHDPKPYLAALLSGVAPPREGRGDGQAVELFLWRAGVDAIAPWLLLRLADVEHTLVDVDRQKPSAALLAMNPTGTVPVLRDGEVSVWESHAVMRYICNRFAAARRFYPADYILRARCDQALDWRATCWARNIVACAGPALGLSRADADAESAASEALTNEASGCFKVLVDHFLAGRPFVCGDEVSLADLALVPPLKLLEACPHIEVPAKVRAYAARFAEATGWAEVADGAGGPGLSQFITDKTGPVK